MRAMTGEVRVMPLAFISAMIFCESCLFALAPPLLESDSTSEPVQPATAIAAISIPARSKLAIILSASSPVAGAFGQPVYGKSAGRLGRLTLKIDYRKP